MGLVIVGLGPLGIKTVQYAMARGLNVVGAVDIDPVMQQKSLGEVCGCPTLNVPISSRVAEVVGAKIALITTVSSLKKFMPQLRECVAAGLQVVSSCEELVYPWVAAVQEAEEIDRLARGQGVSVVGSGVNPGFLMDFLPAILTGLCQRVDSLKVLRFQNVIPRRLPFRQKIGVGNSLEEFRARQAKGLIRHVGLSESVAMSAAALGWRLDHYDEELAPIMAENDIELSDMSVKAGQVAGVEQFGRGWVDGKERITLHFRAAASEPRSYDQVIIKGLPDIESSIEGGVHGDVATAAILLNAAARIEQAKPGLRTMLDLPLLGGFGSLMAKTVGS